MKKEKQFLKKMLKNVKSATSYENICHYSKVMLFFCKYFTPNGNY